MDLRRLIFGVIICFSVKWVSAQSVERGAVLDSLRVQFQQSFEAEQARAKKYAFEKNIPLKNRYSDGTLIELVDVDAFGQPVYRSTYNQGLAQSTNVVKLRSGGGLGLDLKGTGIEVGVWDGGPVFEHDEYRSRIKSREGGTAIDHATHVAGTVLAQGLNANAMGMAYDATLHSYDWNNDRGEMISMARPDQSGLLFSNHSYGLLHGWNCTGGSCTWFGTPGISDKEDWRFGFYTTLSRDLDNIAFNAPYYSIFWAAGNDRDDAQTTGGALYPPDGNQGSGYDCMVQEGSAKNVFTIGASRKVLNYTGPSSVEMSAFSSWGPTDDGRIKPDLVAPGVSIFSTVTNNSYAFLQGTSMATPGAMGSLVLIQDLYKKLNGGKVMRSATLKALAIHSAKEAGLNPGPDYSFGWGLIDVEAAARVLLSQDAQNVFVEEVRLQNNQSYELILSPALETKITATIAWTDPAGTPVGSSLDPTNLMLVNDLDIRLIDDAGNTSFPWALNPELSKLGEAAYKADNFRDNVEKLEFDNPQQRNYKLRITHKGSLVGGAQEFSLILTYTSSKDPLQPLYWVGGAGNWNDPNRWSKTSGGTAALVVPTADNRVIIDENSFGTSGNQIQVTADVQVGSLTWLDRLGNGLALNGKTIAIKGNLIVGSDKMTISSEGKFVLEGSLSDNTKVVFSDSDLALLNIETTGSSTYTVNGKFKVKEIVHSKGQLVAQTANITASRFVVGASSKADISKSELVIGKELTLHSSGVQFVSKESVLVPQPGAILNLGDREVEGSIVVNSPDVTILGNNIISNITLSKDLKLMGNNNFKAMALKGGASLKLKDGTKQKMPQALTIESTDQNRVTLSTISGNATLEFAGRYKLCFNHLDISNVSVSGDAVINAGLASVINNAGNWAKDECDRILFPDFSLQSSCANGMSQLVDLSKGAIESWEWSSSTSANIIDKNKASARIIFSQAGTFDVRLKISNKNDSREYVAKIEVKENDLPANKLVLNGLNLFSSSPSDKYEWYRDFSLIPNQTGRSFPYNGEPGAYFVLTRSSTCNRISDIFVITSVEREPTSQIQVFPNPARNEIQISGLAEATRIQIIDALGRSMAEMVSSTDITVSINEWPVGLYILKAQSNTFQQTVKFLKNE